MNQVLVYVKVNDDRNSPTKRERSREHLCPQISYFSDSLANDPQEYGLIAMSIRLRHRDIL